MEVIASAFLLGMAAGIYISRKVLKSVYQRKFRQACDFCDWKNKKVT
jgi:hypothetical protein